MEGVVKEAEGGEVGGEGGCFVHTNFDSTVTTAISIIRGQR